MRPAVFCFLCHEDVHMFIMAYKFLLVFNVSCKKGSNIIKRKKIHLFFLVNCPCTLIDNLLLL